MPRAAPATVEEYVAALTDEQRAWVEELRDVIRSILPDATETISYQIPAYKVNGKAVVWFAVFKDHYSLYPATEPLRQALGDEIKPYLSGKGTLRLPADKPVPRALVEKIVRLMREERAAAYRG